jgi:hypothetical protein
MDGRGGLAWRIIPGKRRSVSACYSGLNGSIDQVDLIADMRTGWFTVFAAAAAWDDPAIPDTSLDFK